MSYKNTLLSRPKQLFFPVWVDSLFLQMRFCFSLKIPGNKFTLKFRFIVNLDLILPIVLFNKEPTSKSDQVLQNQVQLNSECLQIQSFYSVFLGNLYQCFIAFILRDFFIIANWRFLLLQVVPFASHCFAVCL